ncbi:kinesin heavy chain-like [Culicoides brevitarsis]|uniref:kinesin heavy chain-like n=1 Tax=Culicoides brevitarsis TaxID=469753 RepID=UPI00307BF6F0
MSSQVKETSSSVKVLCRFRPLNASELRNQSKACVSFYGNEENSVSIQGKLYVFDRVFPPNTTQTQVYDVAAKSIVTDVLNGYNGTIFAYGQTSSGKTHTMEGVIRDDELQGIIPRIVHDIFNHIYEVNGNAEFIIKVSYYEIYMEKVRDLLDITKMNLCVKEDKNRVPYVKGATERFVTSPEEVFEVIEEGKSNRHIAVTNMNEHSSRSHSVFLINVQQESLEDHRKLSGKLYLVDLAGSEKVSKTGAEGHVLDEAKNINKSLSALGNVISALADGHKSHIPYRDSKLTRILQESLGGNAKTTIIICCSPAEFNEAETRTTLDFGKRAKTIHNVVTINEDLTADEWKSKYEREKEKVAKLRGKLEQLEDELSHWRQGQTISAHEFSYLDESTFSSNSLTESGRGISISEDDRMSDFRGSFSAGQLDALRTQIEEQDQLIEQAKKDQNQLETEITRIQKENEHYKKEISTVIGNLEELAERYEQKMSEIDTKNREITMLTKDLESHKVGNASKLQALSHETLRNLLSDITEVAHSLSLESPLHFKSRSSPLRLDHEFAKSQYFIKQMKNQAKILLQRCNTLENQFEKSNNAIEERDTELRDARTLIHKYEKRLMTMQIMLEKRGYKGGAPFPRPIGQMERRLSMVKRYHSFDVNPEQLSEDALLFSSLSSDCSSIHEYSPERKVPEKAREIQLEEKKDGFWQKMWHQFHLPFTIPPLEFHLLLSLAMVLVTHQCPQYLIVC